MKGRYISLYIEREREKEEEVLKFLIQVVQINKLRNFYV